MATSITSAVLLSSQETNGGGRLTRWRITGSVDAGDTEITGGNIRGTAFVGGQGTLISVLDAGAANSGLGILKINGAGTTGLSLDFNMSSQNTNFRNNVDGGSSAAVDTLTNILLTVVIAT